MTIIFITFIYIRQCGRHSSAILRMYMYVRKYLQSVVVVSYG